LIMCAMKVFEDAVNFVCRNSSASVLNSEKHVPLRLRLQTTTHSNLAGQCEFECVSDNIEHDFLTLETTMADLPPTYHGQSRQAFPGRPWLQYT
jgi:hypothetical protein